MSENQLSVQYTSLEATGRDRPARDSKLGTWLLASAVISVTTLYTICNPKSEPRSVAQTVKVSKQLSADSAPTGRNPASTVQANGETAFPATEMPKAAEAKTSKSKKDFMVPPPPPTPCVLPPAFGPFPMQPAQQHTTSQQQLQQAQAEPSPETDNQSAAREHAPQESDQELQAADQELQAAIRSSLLTVGEWKR